MRYAVIMAGGSGTRLWPMSTAETPKQLIPFLGGRSLLRVAADRLEGLIEPERQLICTGERFRGAVQAAMPRFGDGQVLGEPEGRDTLAAVGLPAAVASRLDREAVIAVFTADHLIEPIDVFQERVRLGLEIAERHADTLVTFGITPTHPATGYGYVRLGEPLGGVSGGAGGAHIAAAFREKPDEPTARHYVESGDYLWNSGMFVWRASALLGCIERYRPEVHAGLMRIAEAWDTPDRARVLREVYPKLEKVSVDFAVMEPASDDESVRVVTVAMPVKWLDVGGWPAFGETLEADADADGNRTTGVKALPMDSANTLIVGDQPDHLVATLGVENLIVVHTSSATLICGRDAAERIKQLHQAVRETFGEQYV